MDVVYFLKHSDCADFEIRYSLRSLARYFPTVSKVWIFGDRPAFLVDDRSIVEHVPHEYIARAFGFETPITNFFLLQFASAQIPDLSVEFLRFSDDYVLLDELTPEAARAIRYVEDLDQLSTRGSGLWMDSLWRTHGLLKRFGYPCLNYETHTPTYYRRRWVFEAYSEFRDFVTQDRFYGMLGPTAIINHAVFRNALTPVHLDTEGTRAGFWGRQPSYRELVDACEGRLFFNFDDGAFGESIRQFLRDRFPQMSRYEKFDDSGAGIAS